MTFHRADILAHRGLWNEPEEKNSLEAISAAASRGYGLELDIRDHAGRLVVSHDVPDETSPIFIDILQDLVSEKFGGVLAVNVKADGLGELLDPLKPLLHKIDYFLFDMSIPQAFHFSQESFALCARVSEFEPSHSIAPFFQSGRQRTIWLDSFRSDWWINSSWSDLFHPDDKVFVVSPELHGRPTESAWNTLATWIQEGQNVGICTDYPQAFEEFLGASCGR